MTAVRRFAPEIRLGAAGAAYIAVIWWIFVSFLDRDLGVSGATPGTMNAPEIAAVGILAWLPVLALPRAFGLASDMVVWLMYVLVYVPSIIVVDRFVGLERLVPIAAALALAMVLLGLAQRLPRPSRWPRLQVLSPRQHGRTILALSVIGTAIFVWRFGLEVSPPSLDGVYEVRATYKAALVGQGIFAYAAPWLSYAVLPLALAIGLRDRRLELIVAGLAGEYLVFAVTGFRSAALVVGIVFGVGAVVWVARRLRTGVRAWAMTTGATLVVGFGGLLASRGITYPEDMLSRRLIIVPGELMAYYSDYFLNHPVFELRHSILKFLGLPTYGVETPPEIIGRVYVQAGLFANAGVWADGIANFALPGVILFTIGLIGLLWVTDVVTRQHDLFVLIGAGAVVGFVMCNTGLLTAIGSSGVGLLILLLAIGRGRTGADRPPGVGQPAAPV